MVEPHAGACRDGVSGYAWQPAWEENPAMWDCGITRIDPTTVLPFPGVADMLAGLDRWGLASNKERTSGRRELERLGCRHAQGYLFSPPVPIEKVPALITQWTNEASIAA